MHTPGPWRVEGNRVVTEYVGDQIEVQTGEEGRGEDLLLIAAGPELLEACMTAQGAYEALKLLGADTHLPGYESCLDKLNTAIAKATGQI